MLMIPLALVVFAAGPTACEKSVAETAHAALRTFIDPSDTIRRTETSNLLRGSIEDLDDLDPASAGCLATVVRELRGFGQPDVVATWLGGAAVSEVNVAEDLVRKSNRSKEPSRRDLRRTETLLAAASIILSERVAFEQAQERVARGDRSCLVVQSFGCLAQIPETIVKGGADSGPEGSESEDRSHAIRMWRALQLREPDRLKRLQVLLALRSNWDLGTSSADTRAEVILRQWALALTIGDPDPRRWKPDEVGVVVAEARREARTIDMAPEVLSSGSVNTAVYDHGDPSATHQNRLREYVAWLAPMGQLRVAELVSRGIDDREPSAGRATEGRGNPHFDLEDQLYREEWVASHPTSLQEGDANRDRTRAREDYVTKRWRETDLAAPHPELGAILQTVRRFEVPGSRAP